MKIKGKLKFTKGQNEFYTTLKQRVNQHFETHQISRYGNTEMVVKTILLILAYFVPFFILLTVSMPLLVQLSLWALMGLSTAGIGMSVMHDSNHGAYSANPKVNQWLGYTINLVGGIAHNWKLQHNILHHTYTNIAFMDDDIDPKGGMRFSPHHALRKDHALQHVYAFFLYGFSTIYWVFGKDYYQMYKYSRNGVNPNSKKQNVNLLIRMILIKTLYYVTFIVLPIWLGGLGFWQVLLGFFLMHFVCGMVLSIIFQMAHTVEGTHHPLPNDAGTIENNWAIHQMQTTCNFSPDNKVLSWYLGGLNYQVEHHLFPRICHVHYPAISKIVKATAKEYGVPYLENKTFGEAFRSHVRTLKVMGRETDLNEVIG